MRMKYAIIREDKIPPDSRVVLTPSQVKQLLDQEYDIVVQRSRNRCFPDSAYEALGIPMVDDISDRDVLIGVKEVPKENILPGKTYFMFSHTIKEQPYNQGLLRRIIAKKSSLIDYEMLTNQRGARVIAFGKFAGMVGAHNAMHTYGKRTGEFDLPRMNSIDDYKAAKEVYKTIKFPPVKIVLTGTGRVSGGAALVLSDMGIRKVTPLDFLEESYDEAVYSQLTVFYYVKRKDGSVFEKVEDFYNNPTDFESEFEHYTHAADIMINGIYWDPQAPAFFTADQMKQKAFNIKVIADVTCDIAPESSIPSTLKASTIKDPIFGYNPKNMKEDKPFQEDVVDMMTIDNLPNELPKDASEAFGNMFIEYVLPELSKNESEMVEMATIVKKGRLGKYFEYLRDYAGL